MKNIVLTIITFILVGATIYGVVNLYGIWQEGGGSVFTEEVKEEIVNTNTNNTEKDDMNSIEIGEMIEGEDEQDELDEGDLPLVGEDPADVEDDEIVEGDSDGANDDPLDELGVPSAEDGNENFQYDNLVTLSSPQEGSVSSPIEVRGNTALDVENVNIRITSINETPIIEVNPRVAADGSFKITIEYDFDNTNEGYLMVYTIEDDFETIYKKIKLQFE